MPRAYSEFRRACPCARSRWSTDGKWINGWTARKWEVSSDSARLSTSTGSVQRLGGFWISVGVSVCAESDSRPRMGDTEKRMDGVQMGITSDWARLSLRRALDFGGRVRVVGWSACLKPRPSAWKSTSILPEVAVRYLDCGRLSVRRGVGEQWVLSQNHGWGRMNSVWVEVRFGDPGAASVFWIVKGDAFYRTREIPI